MLAPLSIPSPPLDWQFIPVGDWLRNLGLTWITAPLEIRIYALAILLGIVAAVWLTGRRLTARGADPAAILDVAIWAVPFGIVGARVYHVLTHPDDYFGPGMDIKHVFYIWEGGIAIFGALIGGAIGVFIGCRIIGLRFSSFADALAPGLLLAQAFGRLGNYFNHELFGWPTDLPWGLEIESDNAAYPAGLPDGVLFHPTFLYEIIWNLLGVAVILYLGRQLSTKKTPDLGIIRPILAPTVPRLQWGKLIGVYFIWYGAGRIVWETIRIDPSEIFLGIRTNVWGAIAAVVLGLVIIAVQSRRHFGLEPSVYLPGRQWVPVVDSEETYSDTDEPGNDAVEQSESPVLSGPATSGTGKTS